MYGPRNIRDLHHLSSSSVNLSPPKGNTDNVLFVPQSIRTARSEQNLTSGQDNHPLPSTPNHAPVTPPKLPPTYPSPRPSITISDNDNWSGQLLINKLSPRPSVTSLDAVTLSNGDCLGDGIETYIQSQRRLTVGVILLGGVVLVLLVLVSLGLVWFATYEVPRNRMVAAHVVINSTGLREEQEKQRISAQINKHSTSCKMGTELKPWNSEKGTSVTLRGITFDKPTNRLVITETGHYFVYSQVVFDKVGNKTGKDPVSDSLFHVMCKTSPVDPKPKELLEATETPNKVTDWGEGTPLAFHTSHISGVVLLLKGDEIYVKVSNLALVHRVGKARNIYTGLFRLPTAATDPGMQQI